MGEEQKSNAALIFKAPIRHLAFCVFMCLFLIFTRFVLEIESLELETVTSACSSALTATSYVLTPPPPRF